MIAWGRSQIDRLCGMCSSPIQVGEPVLVRSIANVKAKKFRCENCAGEAPPDIPPLVVTQKPEPTPQFERFDYKLAQSGDER